MMRARSVRTAMRASARGAARRTSTVSTEPVKTCFLGGGKMAEAMIAGLVDPAQKSGGKPGFHVTAVDPSKARRELLDKEYGVEAFQTLTSASQAIKESDLLILAVKPRTINTLFEQLRNAVPEKEDRTFTAISIVAGLPMDKIRTGLETTSVCRAMPNTPSTIGEGMTVWASDVSVSEDTEEKIRMLFEACGEEERVDDEDVLDMATAISGSGPAYFLMVMEAMVDSGVHMGLSRELALRLVMQTMRGTAEMAASADDGPTILRNNITSPGGTTSEALFHLERGALRTVVSDACWAAFRKSRELGEKSSDIGPEINR